MRRVVLSFVLLCAMVFPVIANAQERQGIAGRLHLGTDVGFQLGTIDDTAAAFAFSGDYFLDRNVSVGPLIQLAFTDDLSQIGVSMQMKYTFDLAGNPDLKPHLQGGLGFINADKDLPGGGSQSDTSFLVPLGGGFEYQLAKNLYANSNILLNFTDLRISSADDNSHLAWYFGLRFVL